MGIFLVKVSGATYVFFGSEFRVERCPGCSKFRVGTFFRRNGNPTCKKLVDWDGLGGGWCRYICISLNPLGAYCLPPWYRKLPTPLPWCNILPIPSVHVQEYSLTYCLYSLRLLHQYIIVTYTTHCAVYCTLYSVLYLYSIHYVSNVLYLQCLSGCVQSGFLHQYNRFLLANVPLGSRTNNNICQTYIKSILLSEHYI